MMHASYITKVPSEKEAALSLHQRGVKFLTDSNRWNVNGKPHIVRQMLKNTEPTGRRKREQGSLSPWILKMLAKIGCFLSFEWDKTKFTTFGTP